jgi:hypothetical protein
MKKICKLFLVLFIVNSAIAKETTIRSLRQAIAEGTTDFK